VEIHLEPSAERLLGQIKVLRGSHLQRAVGSMTCDERRRLTTGLRRLVELTRHITAQED
jgi:hypothetical protein